MLVAYTNATVPPTNTATRQPVVVRVPRVTVASVVMTPVATQHTDRTVACNATVHHHCNVFMLMEVVIVRWVTMVRGVRLNVPTTPTGETVL